jgi:hypothetical protein
MESEEPKKYKASRAPKVESSLFEEDKEELENLDNPFDEKHIDPFPDDPSDNKYSVDNRSQQILPLSGDSLNNVVGKTHFFQTYFKTNKKQKLKDVLFELLDICPTQYRSKLTKLIC